MGKQMYQSVYMFMINNMLYSDNFECYHQIAQEHFELIDWLINVCI